MVGISVNFIDFVVESNVLNLQNDFILQSSNYSGKNFLFKQVQYDDFEITLNEKKTVVEDLPETYRFYEDFLIPEIQNLSSINIKIFNNSIGKYKSTEDRKLIARRYDEKLSGFFGQIQTNPVIREDIKKLLLDQLDIFHEDVKSFIENPYSKVKDKIVFKWSRTDVTYFFYLLREQKQILYITDGHLGRIIDHVFECHDKDGNVKSIRLARKQITNYTNYDREEKQPKKRLKKIFSSIFKS
jgi:hypothetical protein